MKIFFKDKHVLVVDDDLRNSYALSSALKKFGLHIDIAENCKMAVDFLANGNNHVDLVLMDIMMPIMDGYEAIGRIRKMKQFQTLPIIALTANAMAEDREKCIKAGANDYFTKPMATILKTMPGPL
jgi:CheY-like chemotaxis protein